MKIFDMAVIFSHYELYDWCFLEVNYIGIDDKELSLYYLKNLFLVCLLIHLLVL